MNTFLEDSTNMHLFVAAGAFSCMLKYQVKDCDPNTGEVDDEGYEDEYALEDVDVCVADFMQRVSLANFSAAWEELGPTNELEDTFALSHMTSLNGTTLSALKVKEFQLDGYTWDVVKYFVCYN